MFSFRYHIWRNAATDRAFQTTIRPDAGARPDGCSVFTGIRRGSSAEMRANHQSALTPPGGSCEDNSSGMKATAVEVEKIDGPGLARAGFKAHCPHCRQESVFVRARVSNTRHLLLTLATGGLWGVVWAGLLLGKGMRPWRCGMCGWHKPEFRKIGETLSP